MNPYRKGGTWTWGPAGRASKVIVGLETGEITVEEAASVIAGYTMTLSQQGLAGFWDFKQDKACREGKPMQDINPARFPTGRGPRDV